MNSVCQCEHASHFSTADDSGKQIPAVQHEYGGADVFRNVKTTYGTFTLCRECYTAGHMQEANA